MCRAPWTSRSRDFSFTGTALCVLSRTRSQEDNLQSLARKAWRQDLGRDGRPDSPSAQPDGFRQRAPAGRQAHGPLRKALSGAAARRPAGHLSAWVASRTESGAFWVFARRRRVRGWLPGDTPPRAQVGLCPKSSLDPCPKCGSDETLNAASLHIVLTHSPLHIRQGGRRRFSPQLSWARQT